MSFKEFMRENWIKSIVIFLVFSAFTVLTLFSHSLFEGADEGLTSIITSLLFFVSLIFLWPYLVITLVTESPVVWLGIEWNTFLTVSVIIINVLYIYTLSCSLIALVHYIKRNR